MTMLAIGLYLLVQLIIGYVVSRRIKTEDDFFLGGRVMPTWALSFSLFATWFGAETCIGSSAAVFEKGLSGSKAEPFGYGACLLITALFMAPRIWKAKYTTLGDFYSDRYGKMAEQISIWILIPSSLMWASAQIKAFGEVISATSSLPIEYGIVFATCFVIVYTFMGGMLGDIVTDVLQGSILAITLLIVLVMAVGKLGGLDQAIASIDVAKLSFVSPDQSFFKRMDSWVIPILGSMAAQELVARVLSAKSAQSAKNSTLIGFGMYMFFGSIPIFLGLIGHNFVTSVESTEQFLPTMAKSILPNFMYVVFAGALISAILSTIDSILLAISALVSHNFLNPLLKVKSAKQKVINARLVIVGAGIICYVIAMYTKSIYQLVEDSSAFGTAGILVITIFGLIQKRGKHVAATTTMMFGFVITVFLKYIIRIEASFSISLILTAIFFLLMAHYEERRYPKMQFREES
jgi:SSS family transporter